VSAVFWWTRPDGSYGKIRAASAADARKKRPGAKIHSKPPFSWMPSSPRAPVKRKRTSKKAAAPKKRTSRPAVTRRKRVSRPATRKTSRPAAPRKAAAPKESRSETNPEQKALAETHRLLAQWKVPGYAAVFSNRLTSSMGRVNHRSKVITYSRPIWERATAEDRRVTVIHEVAHAIVAHFHGRAPGVSHGAQWKRQMRAMGIKKPQRCHKVSTEGLKRQRRDTVAVTCCGNEFRVTLKRLHRSLASGARCKCRGGGTDAISFATKQDEARYQRYTQPLRANVSICELERRRSR